MYSSTDYIEETHTEISEHEKSIHATFATVPPVQKAIIIEEPIFEQPIIMSSPTRTLSSISEKSSYSRKSVIQEVNIFQHQEDNTLKLQKEKKNALELVGTLIRSTRREERDRDDRILLEWANQELKQENDHLETDRKHLTDQIAAGTALLEEAEELFETKKKQDAVLKVENYHALEARIREVDEQLSDAKLKLESVKERNTTRHIH